MSAEKVLDNVSISLAGGGSQLADALLPHLNVIDDLGELGDGSPNVLDVPSDTSNPSVGHGSVTPLSHPLDKQ